MGSKPIVKVPPITFVRHLLPTLKAAPTRDGSLECRPVLTKDRHIVITNNTGWWTIDTFLVCIVVIDFIWRSTHHALTYAMRVCPLKPPHLLIAYRTLHALPLSVPPMSACRMRGPQFVLFIACEAGVDTSGYQPSRHSV